MATPLIQPAGIDNESWSRLLRLDESAQRTIVAQFNTDHNVAAFNSAVSAYSGEGTASQRLSGLVGNSGSGSVNPMFRSAKVLPFSIPPAADRALDAMATLDMSNGDARAGIVTGIGNAINPTA